MQAVEHVTQAREHIKQAVEHVTKATEHHAGSGTCHTAYGTYNAGSEACPQATEHHAGSGTCFTAYGTYNAGSGTYRTRILPFVPSLRASFSVFKELYHRSVTLSNLNTEKFFNQETSRLSKR